MEIPLINPIPEVWSQWKGQGYPKTAVTGVKVYYISGYLHNLSDSFIKSNLTSVLILDGTFGSTEAADEALEKSSVFSGFVLVQEEDGKQVLRYQEPYAATPEHAAYAVTWVEVRIAD